MTWEGWEDRELAERICTLQELEVMRAKARGYGRRRGSIVLGIGEDMWRYFLNNGLAAIERARREGDRYALRPKVQREHDLLERTKAKALKELEHDS